MKYYYGNDVKEALYNDPVEIKSTRVLNQYYECYNVVISEDEVKEFYGDDEDEDFEDEEEEE